jgi:sigma-B regulation protein RsbU (phosphoserine phosphatase)
MNVFVVDDDRLCGTLLKRTLERFGFKVIECRDGMEALQLLEESGPALLVLDYEMPELNGAQVCEIVRKYPDPDIAEIPIILLTAHTDERKELECLNAGANDFVTKPVNLAVLKARIDTHVRLYELRRQLQEQNAELERFRTEMEQDLESARLTQLAIVPHKLPEFPGWDLAATLQPLIQVGGDMYDVFEISDGRVLLWIADATGHGTAAALLTTLIKLIFRHAAIPHSSPAQIMQRVHREFYSVFRGRAFLTAACVIMQAGSGVITMSGAGHPPLLIRRKDGKCEGIMSASPPVGVVEHMETEEASIELRPGDAFLVHTDGLFDVRAEGKPRLDADSLAALMPDPGGSANRLLKGTMSAVRQYGNGDAFTDDVAAIAALMLA